MKKPAYLTIVLEYESEEALENVFLGAKMKGLGGKIKGFSFRDEIERAIELDRECDERSAEL